MTCEGRYIVVTSNPEPGVKAYSLVDTKYLTASIPERSAGSAVALYAKRDELNKWEKIEEELRSLAQRFGEFISGPEPGGAYTLRLNDNHGVYAMVDYDLEYRVGLYISKHDDNSITDLKSFDTIGEVRDYLILLETIFSGTLT